MLLVQSKTLLPFTGINWKGIEVQTPGSLIKYSKIIEEGGGSGNGDYMIKLDNSEIHNSRISGSRNGIKLNEFDNI